MKKKLRTFNIVLAAIIVTQLINYFFFLKPLPQTQEPQKQNVQQKLSQKLQSWMPDTALVYKQHNFHVIVPGIWRSAKPNEESIRLMKKYGLKTIINLRNNSTFHQWEKNLSSDLGVQYYHYPMGAREKPNYEEVKEILNIIHDPQHQPVLIHCHAGKDRTGLIVALYKRQFMGESVEDVRREMLMYGYDERTFPILIETVRSWCQETTCIKKE